MTTDNDLLDDTDLDETDADTDDSASDDSEKTDQEAPSLDQVLARVAALEAVTAAHKRDITAAVGRFQSLQDKIDAGTATAAELRGLKTAQAAAQEAIDALLEDEAIDPKVKAKAADARSRAAVAAAEDERKALLERLAALERGEKAQPAVPAEVSPFEQSLWDMIESFGLDKTDPIFDWKGEATSILTSQGEAATRRYFTQKIRERLEGNSTTDRRQMRKSAGTAGATRPAGAGVKALDASKSNEDNLKTLAEWGLIQ